MNEIVINKNEMYMANLKMLHWRPNASYLPLILVGGLLWGMANFMFLIGGKENIAFLDTNMLVSPTQIFALGEPSNAKIHIGPTPVVLRHIFWKESHYSFVSVYKRVFTCSSQVTFPHQERSCKVDLSITFTIT